MSDTAAVCDQSDLGRIATERFSQLADSAFARYEHELAQAAPTEIACKSGCSYCCRALKVSVSLPEIFLLKFHVTSLPAAESVALRQRIADIYSRTLDNNAQERLLQHESCPLLVDNRCSVYEVRPLSCRAAVSLDADACRRAYAGEKVKINMPQRYFEALKTSSLLLLATMSAAGLDCRSYELNAALHIALSEPDAERRWLDGENIFAIAELR
jgi:Fe-S-cluster containining protein